MQPTTKVPEAPSLRSRLFGKSYEMYAQAADVRILQVLSPVIWGKIGVSSWVLYISSLRRFSSSCILQR